jgi:hypothetical protein
MSYDLQLVKVGPDERAEDVAMRDEEDGPLGPPDSQKEALKRRLSEALVAADKALKPFRFDHKKIAQIRKIPVEQARQDVRHIELTDEANGIQIVLFDDQAAITVPYWHSGETARRVFERILGHIRIIARESGYVAFDPQLGKVIDPDADLDLMLTAYEPIVQQLKTEMAPHTKRPWWKFW